MTVLAAKTSEFSITSQEQYLTGLTAINVPSPEGTGDPNVSELARSAEQTGLSIEQAAVTASSEQDALLDISSLEDRYATVLATYVLAKHEQVDRLESRLEGLLERQVTQLSALQASQPGRFSLSGTRNRFVEAIAAQQAAIQSLQSRLEAVRELRETMGLHAPHIDELAHRKMRFQHPELAQSWDAVQIQLRRQATEQRIAESSQSESRSRGLRRETT